MNIDTMNKEYKIVKFLFYLFASLIIILVSYIHIWESFQEKIIIKNSEVLKIIPYYQSGGDLHWSRKGYRIYINNEYRPIDFPIRKWDERIKESSKVKLIVRKSFFGDELDGLEISPTN